MARPRGRRTTDFPAETISRWRGWPVLVFAGLAAAGLLAHETVEILLNATLLCLSCMGLGK